MDAVVDFRVLPGDWRPQVVAPRMLEMDQEGRLGLNVGHDRADVEQVEDIEAVLDDEDVAVGAFVVGDDAVEDFAVEEIIVENTAVDGATVDDATVDDDAVDSAIDDADIDDDAIGDAAEKDALVEIVAVDGTIVEDAVEEKAAVDDTAADDVTSDDAGSADVAGEDTAEDDRFDEAEESGGLLYGRTSSVFLLRMIFSLSITQHNIPHDESVEEPDKSRTASMYS